MGRRVARACSGDSLKQHRIEKTSRTSAVGESIELMKEGQTIRVVWLRTRHRDVATQASLARYL